MKTNDQENTDRIEIYNRNKDSLNNLSKIVRNARPILISILTIITVLSIPILSKQKIDNLRSLFWLFWNLKLSIFLTVFCLYFYFELFQKQILQEHFQITKKGIIVDSVLMNGKQRKKQFYPKEDIKSIFIYEVFGMIEVQYRIGMRVKSNNQVIKNPFKSDYLLSFQKLNMIRKKLNLWFQCDQTPKDKKKIEN